MRNLTSLIVTCLFAAAVGTATAAELGMQKSTDRGVTVAVTPQSLADEANTWDFNIVLDTHSQDLSDDLTKSAVLLDSTGARHAPVAWEGAAPGGHHRQGVLRFKSISPLPDAVELQITRIGESVPRSFRWQLK